MERGIEFLADEFCDICDEQGVWDFNGEFYCETHADEAIGDEDNFVNRDAYLDYPDSLEDF